MINYWTSKIVFFVGALLVGQVLSQDNACARVTGQDLGDTSGFSRNGILATVISPSGEGENSGLFRVTNVHIVSEAQHLMQDRYRYTSILVSYICESVDTRLGFCDGTTIHTVQLTLGCVDNAWSTTILNDGNFALTQNPTANISTELVSNCIISISPQNFFASSLTIDPETHCVGTSACMLY